MRLYKYKREVLLFVCIILISSERNFTIEIVKYIFVNYPEKN